MPHGFPGIGRVGRRGPKALKRRKVCRPWGSLSSRLGINLFAEDLHDRPNETRVRAEAAKRLGIEVGGKGRARRAVVFAPHLLAVEGKDAPGLRRQEAGFRRREDIGQEDIAVALEAGDLIVAQYVNRLIPSIFINYNSGLKKFRQVHF